MWLVAVVVCLGWILSVCLHEFGHAVVAYWGGDTSVKDKGYLTLNPLKYTDPGLSLLLPIIFLVMGGIALPGAAVYINHRRLRNRWWESAVSAAGPFASAIATLLLALPFWFNLIPPEAKNWLEPSLAFLILLEIAAILLNLLPVPPLDGYGIIEPWLSADAKTQFNKFNRYGIWFVFGLLWFVPSLNHFFWNWANTISETLGVDSEMAARGYGLFKEQSKFLLLGLLGILWLFRRKEIDWYNRGNKRTKAQRYEEALAAYEQAIKIKPDYYEAWYAKAYTLYELQRYEEAIASSDKAIQLQFDNPYAWYIKACSYAEQGNVSVAIETLQQAINLDPKFKEYAQTDSSFDTLRENRLFKDLIKE